MHQFYDMLKANRLFRHFGDNDLNRILLCLNAHVKAFSKNQVIRQANIEVDEIGIILSGTVFVTKYDYNGNRTILSEHNVGGSFGESLSFVDSKNSPIIIIAAEKSQILFISSRRILEGCAAACGCHQILIRNLITSMAQKITTLQIKNDILSRKTIREKLLLYFEYETRTTHSTNFKIHFSRTELADFLSLNVSAMSRELGKMRDEGILTFHKNSFALKNPPKKPDDIYD